MYKHVKFQILKSFKRHIFIPCPWKESGKARFFNIDQDLFEPQLRDL